MKLTPEDLRKTIEAMKSMKVDYDPPYCFVSPKQMERMESGEIDYCPYCFHSLETHPGWIETRGIDKGIDETN